MNIGFDAKRAYNNATGLGFFSRWLMNSLANNNPENEYFAYTTGIKPSCLVHMNESIKVRLPEKWYHRAYTPLWRSFSLPNLFIKDNIDVYHGLSNELPYGFRNNVRKIVTIHDLIFLRYPEFYNFLDRNLYYNKVKYACGIADIIHATSEATKKDLISFFNIPEHKIKVVYQGCSDAFKQGYSERIIQQTKEKYLLTKPYFLCVGTIEQRKNQLNLVKAFQQLNQTDIDLVLIGKDNSHYALELKKYVQANKLQHTIRVISYVQTEDLPHLYQGAFAFVYPSLIEGFGIPVQEALYSQLPCITSSNTSMQEIAGAAALVINPIEIENLSHALLTLIEKPELRAQLIEEAKLRINLFETSKLVKEYINLYTE